MKRRIVSAIGIIAFIFPLISCGGSDLNIKADEIKDKQESFIATEESMIAENKDSITEEEVSKGEHTVINVEHSTVSAESSTVAASESAEDAKISEDEYFTTYIADMDTIDYGYIYTDVREVQARKGAGIEISYPPNANISQTLEEGEVLYYMSDEVSSTLEYDKMIFPADGTKVGADLHYSYDSGVIRTVKPANLSDGTQLKTLNKFNCAALYPTDDTLNFGWFGYNDG